MLFAPPLPPDAVNHEQAKSVVEIVLDSMRRDVRRATLREVIAMIEAIDTVDFRERDAVSDDTYSGRAEALDLLDMRLHEMIAKPDA